MNWHRATAIAWLLVLNVAGCAAAPEASGDPAANAYAREELRTRKYAGQAKPRFPGKRPRAQDCGLPLPPMPGEPSAPGEPGAPPAPIEPGASCLFGRTYRELRDSAVFELSARELIDSTRAAEITPSQAAQLVAAVQVAYVDATDVGSALASVDQGEVNRLVLAEVDGERTFVAYEYGAGDNSYGAVFEGESAQRVAEIHDGDVLACTVEGTPRGARIGADCGGAWGETCDEGLVCVNFDEDRGAGRCALL